MSELLRDVRFTFRTLRKSPSFTLVVIATLALGIGANTAIFSLMDQLLLRPLPVEAPEGLVVLDAPGPYAGATHNYSEVFTPISHPMFEGLRDRSPLFSGVLSHYTTRAHLTVGRDAQQVTADLVSGTYFDVLGIVPATGRLLEVEDDRKPGAHPVVVLTHRFWQSRFGGRADVVGTSIRLNGQPMTVVGVSARGFHGVEVGQPVDLFVPLMMQAQVLPTWTRGLADWRTRWLTPMARLEDEVTLEEARAGANVVYRQLLEEDLAGIQTRSESFPDRFLQKELVLLPGGRGTSELRYQSDTPLLVLMALVGLVLLIACANVANLFLARISSRRKELSLRATLGAGRLRLMRQLLLESVTLALLGGALGMLVASWTSDALLRALPFQGVTEVFHSDPDLRVGAFALLLSLAASIASGVAPAFAAGRLQIAPVLKEETAALTGRAASARLRRFLVVTQIALSLLLLTAAGLFVKSLRNLRSIDPGFETERLIALSVDPSLNGYDLPKRREVLRTLRDELASEPGVRSVSLAEVAVMTNSTSSSTIRVEGYEAAEGEDMNPWTNGVGPGFFDTLGIELVSGRNFDDADAPDAPAVAVVNEAFVRQFFPGTDPLGRRIGFGRRSGLDVTIVGVVRDAKSSALREPESRFLYVPYMQSSDLGAATFYLRVDAPPEAVSSALPRAVARVDPSLPVGELKTMSVQIQESLFVERLVAALSLAFGTLAALLAALGLYGVMSYAVSLRTRELGIRAALGAGRRGLLFIVLSEVSALTAAGLVLGAASSYVLGRLVDSQLFGVSGRDPGVALLASLTLAFVALAAGYLPAARASRVDPMVALRYE